MSAGSSAATGARSERVPGLDVARAIGVVAMVLGHTCDALLSPAVRAEPFVSAYWKARGFTAPLFLMVSGWAVALAVSRSSARGWAVVQARAPRVLLLLGLGYALRFPAWDVRGLLAGDRGPWRHLLAFDALHAIAVALLGTLLVLALPWERRRRGLVLILLAAAAVAAGTRSGSSPPRSILALALAQAAGGSSPFPVFPWAAYFFTGAAIPLLASDQRPHRAAALAGCGVLLVATVGWPGFGALPPGHPVLALFRAGGVLLLLAVLESFPRLASPVAWLSRSSLGLYVIHLPVVYGWGTVEGLAQRVGPRLPLRGAALVALAVLTGALALERTARLAWRRIHPALQDLQRSVQSEWRERGRGPRLPLPRRAVRESE